MKNIITYRNQIVSLTLVTFLWGGLICTSSMAFGAEAPVRKSGPEKIADTLAQTSSDKLGKSSSKNKEAPKSKKKKLKPVLFGNLIKNKIRESKTLKTAELAMKTAKAQVSAAKAKWLPTLDLTVDLGHEDQVKPNAADTRESFDEVGIEIKQKLLTLN